MTVAEITAEALRQGLLTTKGKTPEQSMAARLYVETRDNPTGPVRRLYEEGVGRLSLQAIVGPRRCGDTGT